MSFPEKLALSVTQDDIDRGYRCDCSSCPIALAMRRLYPNYSVKAKLGYILIIEKDDVLIQYKVPIEAVAFMEDFDDYGPTAVSPRKFEMERIVIKKCEHGCKHAFQDSEYGQGLRVHVPKASKSLTKGASSEKASCTVCGKEN